MITCTFADSRMGHECQWRAVKFIKVVMQDARVVLRAYCDPCYRYINPPGQKLKFELLTEEEYEVMWIMNT